jgi:hypothetical protein
MESTRMWKILMGELIPGESENAGHLFEEAEKHIRSLDEYIDLITHKKLQEIGMPVINIYELFSIIIENFKQWLLGGADKVSSMYDKQLVVLYYLMYNVTSAINNLYFRLKAAEEKAAKAGKELTFETVNGLIKEVLKPGLIFKINKKHGEVSTISAPGDNMAFKMTAVLVSQADSNQSSPNKDRAGTNDPTRHLHASIAEVGNYSALPKSSPYGRGRTNPTVKLDANGVIQRNPEFKEQLDQLQEEFRR